jgi:predicted RNA binding protein YcfA (HicA-like mRNA interferase family)
VTWAEVLRKLKAAGFVKHRSGKGAHVLYRHPQTGRQVWITAHAKQDAGHLGHRILKEAGIE